MGGKTVLTTEKFAKLVRQNKTNFSGSQFERKTDLCFMNLEGFNFKKSIMQDVCLYKTILKEANMEKAKLYLAFLNKTDFTGANLKGVVFSHLTLREVNLTGAKVVDSAMCGTDLHTSVGLASCDFNNTYFNGTKVTAAQKKDILNRYEVVTKRTDKPKVPFIRAPEDEMAFVVVKESRRKN